MTTRRTSNSGGLTVWRLVLVASVTAMVGFVGGVWFISSGVGFAWIRPLQTPSLVPTSAGSAPQVRLLGLASPTAIGLPPARDFTQGSGGLLPRTPRPDLMPSPGCVWEVEPRPFQPDQDWHQTHAERALVGLPMVDSRSGRLRYTLVQSPRRSDSAAQFRVVLFDEAGHRYPSQATGQTTSRSPDGFFEVTRYRWSDDLPIAATGAAYFGVERVIPAATQAAMAAVQAEARSRNVAILPEPRIGEPYRFDLPTATPGRRVRSADLQGKVVLIVVWGPGRRDMGPIRTITKDCPPSELAIVGVSFDPTVEDAAAVFDPLSPKGSLVHVPNDRDSRRFWTEGTSIAQLPTYWLVDRTGVLRYESNPLDLPFRLNILLGRPAEEAPPPAGSLPPRLPPPG